jgi:hypothetical protein
MSDAEHNFDMLALVRQQRALERLRARVAQGRDPGRTTRLTAIDVELCRVEALKLKQSTRGGDAAQR